MLVGELAAIWAGGLSHLKEPTAEWYRGIVRTHSEPRWGTYRLCAVATSDVAAWVGELSATGRAASTVRQIHRVFSLIMDLAVKDGRIARKLAAGGRRVDRRGRERGRAAGSRDPLPGEYARPRPGRDDRPVCRA